MFERDIGLADVRHVLSQGEVIQQYPDARPFPSRLVLGWLDIRPIHILLADDDEAGVTYVITVYEPDALLWDEQFRRRRSG